MVNTTMKTKMKPKSTLSKSFTRFVLAEFATAFEIYDCNLDVERRADVAPFDWP
jgi:hypothetical protein